VVSNQLQNMILFKENFICWFLNQGKNQFFHFCLAAKSAFFYLFGGRFITKSVIQQWAAD
jgi:hypothetical protein